MMLVYKDDGASAQILQGRMTLPQYGMQEGYPAFFLAGCLLSWIKAMRT